MRVHYVLNHGGTPQSKLADVEIHFDDCRFQIYVYCQKKKGIRNGYL